MSTKRCAGCSHPTICRLQGCAAEEHRRIRELAQEMAKSDIASERAMRIARVAAEELVRSQGEHTNTADEFLIPACQADDHMRDCIAHLVWTGEAVFHEREDGYMVVRLEGA